MAGDDIRSFARRTHAHDQSYETAIDHGGQSGLGDDDHTIYLLADGTRSMTGALTADTGPSYDIGSSSAPFNTGWFDALDARVQVAVSRDADIPYVVLRREDSLSVGEFLGIVDFRGHDGTSADQIGARIFASAADAWSGSDHSAHLYFATVASGETTITSRWLVWDNGHLAPVMDSAYDLGLAAARVRTGYFDSVDIADDPGSDSEVGNRGYNDARYHLATVDHGGIGGLGDDDHTQYLRADGLRVMSGANQIFENNANVGLVIRRSDSVSSGEWLGYIEFRGHDGTSASQLGGRIMSNAAEAWSGSTHANNIYFGTTPLGSTTFGWRWYIAADGHLRPYTDSTYDIGASSSRVATGFFDDVDVGNELLFGSVKALSGSGSPESSVTAPVGSLYLRTDGGAGTTLYVKESGTGNTGWVGK